MDEIHAISIKLDNLLEKLEHVTNRVDEHAKLIYGQRGELGLVHQVKLLWRVHGWVACTLSAFAGSVTTLIITWWLQR